MGGLHHVDVLCLSADYDAGPKYLFRAGNERILQNFTREVFRGDVALKYWERVTIPYICPLNVIKNTRFGKRVRN